MPGLLLPLAVLLASPASGEDALRALVEASLRQAAAPGVAVSLQGLSARVPPGCRPSSVRLESSPSATGRIAVRFQGRGRRGKVCRGAAWAEVEARANVAVVARPVRRGEPLDGAVRLELRTLQSGSAPLTALPAGATAARDLSPGTLLEAHHLRPLGLAPGDPVLVEVRSGALVVTETGRVVACGAGRVCARLPSGKRVEGVFSQGRLRVGARAGTDANPTASALPPRPSAGPTEHAEET